MLMVLVGSLSVMSMRMRPTIWSFCCRLPWLSKQANDCGHTADKRTLIDSRASGRWSSRLCKVRHCCGRLPWVELLKVKIELRPGNAVNGAVDVADARKSAGDTVAPPVKIQQYTISVSRPVNRLRRSTVKVNELPSGLR